MKATLPALQKLQCAQGTPGSIATLSPTERLVTPSPSLVTVPDDS